MSLIFFFFFFTNHATNEHGTLFKLVLVYLVYGSIDYAVCTHSLWKTVYYVNYTFDDHVEGESWEGNVVK